MPPISQDPTDVANFDPFSVQPKGNGAAGVGMAIEPAGARGPASTTDPTDVANFDPFAYGKPPAEKTSAIGAATRGVIGGAAPGIGSLPAIAAGAEFGSIFGPIGSFGGGLAGAYFGGQGIATAQNWLLNKVPKIRDLLGQSEEQKRLDEQEHPIASFLGGIAPFALTMSPIALEGKLPANATAWQRLAANPYTARLFSGGVMGGMQLGQEAASEDKINWNRVAVATGFGMIFNRPNRIGEAISEYGARPARFMLGRPSPVPERPPTIAETSEQGVGGPGVTESTFMGSEQRNPVAENAAIHNASIEDGVIGPIRSPDLENTARQKEPELFNEYDDLVARKNTMRSWIDSQNEPKPFQFLELEERRVDLQKELDDHIAERNGYDRGPRARQLKAQIRQVDAEHAALTERAEAFKAGTAVETPDMALARQHLMETDYALRDLQPRIQAAYRAAAEYTGAPTAGAPPEGVAAPPIAPTTETPAGAPAAEAAAGAAAPARPAGPIDEQRAFIQKHVADQMIAAGRPAEEAQLAGRLVANYYAARSARFGGAKGSALDLYNAEGPRIRGGSYGGGGGGAVVKPPPGEPLKVPTTKEEFNAWVKAGGNLGEIKARPKGAEPAPPPAEKPPVPVSQEELEHYVNLVDQGKPAEADAFAEQVLAKNTPPEPVPLEWKPSEHGTQRIESGGFRGDVWKDREGKWHWVANDLRVGIGKLIEGGNLATEAEAKDAAVRAIEREGGKAGPLFKKPEEETKPQVNAEDAAKSQEQIKAEVMKLADDAEAAGQPGFASGMRLAAANERDIPPANLQFYRDRIEGFKVEKTATGEPVKEAYDITNMLRDDPKNFADYNKILDLKQPSQVASVLAAARDKVDELVKSINAAGFKWADVNSATDRAVLELKEHASSVAGATMRLLKGLRAAKGNVSARRVKDDLAYVQAEIKGEPVVIDVKKRATRGPRATDPEKWSLLQFLAENGGLEDTKDTRAIFSDTNPLVPGWGALLRKNGPSIDHQLTNAIEGRYLDRPGPGEPALKPQALRDLIDEEARGTKQYRRGVAPPVKEIDVAEQRHRIESAADEAIERSGVDPRAVSGEIRDRMIELMERGIVHDPLEAWTQADMEIERRAYEAGDIESKYENVPGWDVGEPGPGEAAGEGAPPRGEQPEGARTGEAARPPSERPREPAEATDALAHLSDEDIANFFQGHKGSIRFTEGVRTIITLIRGEGGADASTIIHELGHAWLEEMVRDAGDAAAPAWLKADMETVLRELKIASPEILSETTKRGQPSARARNAHEKFAMSFERYLYEGVAPTPELATVFQRFRAWLLDIYKSVRDLVEISPQIKGVFDRMLAEEPSQAIVGPRGVGGPTLTEIHEADAKTIEPAEGEQAAARIEAERDRYEKEQPEQIKAELDAATKAAGVAAGPGEKPTGEGAAVPSRPGEVVRGGGAAEPIAPGGRGGEEPGKIVEGGTNARPESAAIPGAGTEQRAGSTTEREHPLASGPAPDTIRGGEDRFVDKAGNIRVENVTNVEDMAKAIHDSAERNDDFRAVRGDTMGKGQMWDLASDLGENPDDMDLNALERHLEKLLGGMRDMAPKVLAARRLLKQSAAMVADLMKRVSISDSDEEAAQLALAITRHDMIQSAVSGGTASWGRTGTAFRDITEGWDQVKNVNALLMAKTGRTLFQIKQIAKLGAQYDRTSQISQFVRDSGKPKFGRMITEYWINGLISGIQTHMTYSIGNTILAMEKLGPETMAAAGIGALRKAMGRPGETVRLGEVAAGLRGAKAGFWPAVQSALQAARSGVTTLLPGEAPNRRFMPPLTPGSELVKAAVLNEAATYQDAMATAFGIMRGLKAGVVGGAALQRAGGLPGAPLFGWEYSPLGAIPNFQVRGVTMLPAGELVRAPSRMIAAIHSFFRPLNYAIEIHQRAYREAANANLSGTAFDAKVASIIKAPTEDMMTAGHNASNELTLMGAGGQFTRKLSQLVNTEFMGQKDPVTGKALPGTGIQLLKFIDPFIHISSNIINQSIVQRTPMGLLSPSIRADLMGARGNIVADTAAARMLAGTALSVLFGGLAAEGYITGSEPTNREEAAVWRQVYQAHSVKIGDVWYDMHRLGPMGMLLSTAADLYQVAHYVEKDEYTKAAAMLQHAVTQNILDESFMRGPSDLIKAVEDPARYGENYVKNFVSSFIPFSVAMSQMARAADPYSRDARTVTDAIMAKIPGLSQSIMPRRDVWGELLPSRESLGPPGLLAIWEQRFNDDPVNKAMLNLGIFPAAVGRKIRNVELTPEQYDDWARIAGRLAKLRMNAIVQSPSFSHMPPYLQHDLIAEQLRQSREVARNMMFMKYPSILVDARAAKMQKRMAIGED
jgi:hypothetical protein